MTFYKRMAHVVAVCLDMILFFSAFSFVVCFLLTAVSILTPVLLIAEIYWRFFHTAAKSSENETINMPSISAKTDDSKMPTKLTSETKNIDEIDEKSKEIPMKQVKSMETVVVDTSYQFCLQNGSGRDVAIELQQMDSEVIELMINMVYWATFAPVPVATFVPFPHDLFSQVNSVGFQEIVHAIGALPSAQAMKQIIAARTFHSHFANKAHNLHQAHSLLTWIVTSHKGSLKHISLAQQTEFERNLSASGSLRLFKITNSPEKEASFLQAKGQKKTVWAYHGSAFHNWHSIIHNNLKNCTGTSLEAHGASYGGGIYLGVAVDTSLGYCNPAEHVWPKAKLGTYLKFLHMQISNIFQHDFDRYHLVLVGGGESQECPGRLWTPLRGVE